MEIHTAEDSIVALRKLLCEPWHFWSAAEEAAKQRGLPTQQDSTGEAAAPTPMEVDPSRSDAAQVMIQLSAHTCDQQSLPLSPFCKLVCSVLMVLLLGRTTDCVSCDCLQGWLIRDCMEELWQGAFMVVDCYAQLILSIAVFHQLTALRCSAALHWVTYPLRTSFSRR